MKNKKKPKNKKQLIINKGIFYGYVYVASKLGRRAFPPGYTSPPHRHAASSIWISAQLSTLYQTSSKLLIPHIPNSSHCYHPAADMATSPSAVLFSIYRYAAPLTKQHQNSALNSLADPVPGSSHLPRYSTGTPLTAR